MAAAFACRRCWRERFQRRTALDFACARPTRHRAAGTWRLTASRWQITRYPVKPSKSSSRQIPLAQVVHLTHRRSRCGCGTEKLGKHLSLAGICRCTGDSSLQSELALLGGSRLFTHPEFRTIARQPSMVATGEGASVVVDCNCQQPQGEEVFAHEEGLRCAPRCEVRLLRSTYQRDLICAGQGQRTEFVGPAQFMSAALQ